MKNNDMNKNAVKTFASKVATKLTADEMKQVSGGCTPGSCPWSDTAERSAENKH